MWPCYSKRSGREMMAFSCRHRTRQALRKSPHLPPWGDPSTCTSAGGCEIIHARRTGTPAVGAKSKRTWQIYFRKKRKPAGRVGLQMWRWRQKGALLGRKGEKSKKMWKWLLIFEKCTSFLSSNKWTLNYAGFCAPSCSHHAVVPLLLIYSSSHFLLYRLASVPISHNSQEAQ